MSRLLVTMNTGGSWIPANVEESHRAAASRWQRQYVQLTDVDPLNIFRDKHRWLAECDAESVVWIDGDAIVRYDCPDPYTNGSLVGVSAVQSWDESGIADATSVHQTVAWLEWVTKQIGFTLSPERVRSFVSRSINGGLFAFEPRLHRCLFEWIVRALPESGTFSAMVEQTSINLGALLLNFDVDVMPWEFNRVGPTAWQPGPMRWYVQHLAACGMKVDKREALEAIDWTRKAPHPYTFVTVHEHAEVACQP